MGRRIYVGNLPWSTTSSELQNMFAEHGGVKNAEVISDRETGRSRGFGFVEMESDEGTQAAIAALNGKDMGGRALTVNEAGNELRAPPVAVVAVAVTAAAVTAGAKIVWRLDRQNYL